MGVLRTEAAIRCYKCSVARYVHYINETIRLCEDFDHSDKYIVDCPYSTLCMKRIASAKISDTISGIERDCASQKSENQKLENRTWHLEVTIEEPYEEGCSELNDKGGEEH
ncbi:hypothetical protein NQ317_015520 [Molorchus minor]|uniref:Uncharacterized protein n=1 Tax=Molorchus minor TaxID=1323400 RepID=A0ABQ9JL80_9CUCU|nr:hypothetical protein NQ317_015520 [Molorchus minor]